MIRIRSVSVDFPIGRRLAIRVESRLCSERTGEFVAAELGCTGDGLWESRQRLHFGQFSQAVNLLLPVRATLDGAILEELEGFQEHAGVVVGELVADHLVA